MTLYSSTTTSSCSQEIFDRGAAATTRSARIAGALAVAMKRLIPLLYRVQPLRFAEFYLIVIP